MNSPSPELPELLGSIHNHADLMKIPEAELPRLAEEIRSTLIQSLAVTGGHLGPNLGVVELHRFTASLKRPGTKLIFDVSTRPMSTQMLTAVPSNSYHSPVPGPVRIRENVGIPP